jgi:hypothetical protein
MVTIIKGRPPPLSPEAEGQLLEFARRRDPAVVKRLEELPAFRELVDASFSAGGLALFCLDCLDWNLFDTLRLSRKQMELTRKHLTGALTALKELGDLEPTRSAWQVVIALDQLEPGYKRLTRAALRDDLPAMITSFNRELELFLSKLAVRQGKPRKFSRDFFIERFRGLVPQSIRQQRSFDRQAAELYAALFEERTDPEVYLRRRRRIHQKSPK